jgi:hypothetical protein
MVDLAFSGDGRELVTASGDGRSGSGTSHPPAAATGSPSKRTRAASRASPTSGAPVSSRSSRRRARRQRCRERRVRFDRTATRARQRKRGRADLGPPLTEAGGGQIHRRAQGNRRGRCLQPGRSAPRHRRRGHDRQDLGRPDGQEPAHVHRRHPFPDRDRLQSGWKAPRHRQRRRSGTDLRPTGRPADGRRPLAAHPRLDGTGVRAACPAAAARSGRNLSRSCSRCCSQRRAMRFARDAGAGSSSSAPCTPFASRGARRRGTPTRGRGRSRRTRARGELPGTRCVRPRAA